MDIIAQRGTLGVCTQTTTNYGLSYVHLLQGFGAQHEVVFLNSSTQTFTRLEPLQYFGDFSEPWSAAVFKILSLFEDLLCTTVLGSGHFKLHLLVFLLPGRRAPEHFFAEEGGCAKLITFCASTLQQVSQKCFLCDHFAKMRKKVN